MTNITVGGELVLQVFAAVARMERRLLRKRTVVGLTAARARGLEVAGQSRQLLGVLSTAKSWPPKSSSE